MESPVGLGNTALSTTIIATHRVITSARVLSRGLTSHLIDNLNSQQVNHNLIAHHLAFLLRRHC